MIDWTAWYGLPVAIGIALIAALIVIGVVAVTARLAARRRDGARVLISTARHPFRFLVVMLAVWAACSLTLTDELWRSRLNHGFLIAVIVLGAWFLTALVNFTLGAVQSRYRTDVADNRLARRVQTQLTIVRRLVGVVFGVIATGAILLTFPGVQAVGTSILASAGVLSIVAGLAAQSSLANVFAGVQLAFSDAIRVDDVVIAEGEWGRIEEITLTYVVVHIWDDRRLVLPSTYFTSTPFQNWTRRSSELLGSVELDLDWGVRPSELRAELEAILARTALWDGRASVLQVTDAVGGYVRVRVLVTAVDAPTLFDLRCYVREQFVEWLHANRPDALPATRVRMTEDEAPRERTAALKGDHQGLFTGTPDSEERASLFTSSMPVVPPKR